MKKIISVLLICILAAVLLAGCAVESVSEDETGSDTQIELEVWMCYDRNVPGSYYIFLWDTLAEEYGYTVNVKTYSQQEIEDKLQMAMACNELPDIFMVPGGSYPEMLFASGACLPVEEYLEQADFKEEYTLAYTDGSNYLIPCLPESYAVVYYDESLMELMGLSAPKTWDELLELVQEVQSYNEENGTDYAAVEMGMKDNWMGALLYCLVAEQLDPEFYHELSDGEADGSADAAEQLMGDAAEYLQELMDLGAFPDDYMEIGESEAVKNFINHEAVIMVHQTSLVYHLIQNMGESGFALGCFPGCGGGEAGYGSTYLMEINHTYTPGLAVSARSAYAGEAANLCLDFAERVNEMNVEEYHYLNIMNTDYVSETSSSENISAIHSLVAQAESGDGFLYATLPRETGDAWGNTVKRFFAGEITTGELSQSSADLFR